jgi:hypothetical protein
MLADTKELIIVCARKGRVKRRFARGAMPSRMAIVLRKMGSQPIPSIPADGALFSQGESSLPPDSCYFATRRGEDEKIID